MTSRILAMDIDGTLIGSDKRIREFTRSEVHRVVEEHGVHVVLITARGPLSTAIIEEQLGVPASQVTFGGALIARRDGASLVNVSETTLSTSEVADLALIGIDTRVHVGIYSRNDWFVSDINYWALREARNTAVWPSPRTITEALATDTAWHKVMFRGDPEALAKATHAAQTLEQNLFIHTGTHVTEIFPAAAVKLPALRILAQELGSTLDDVIAFGDTESDVPMLEHAGIGIIMGNAKAGVVVADHVERTLSHDEDGIGVMLRKYFPTAAPFRP